MGVCGGDVKLTAEAAEKKSSVISALLACSFSKSYQDSYLLYCFLNLFLCVLRALCG